MKPVRYGLVAATAIALSSGVVTVAHSQELTGNVALVSDYVFRGYTQTSEEPAIQGGLDLALPANLYVGTWASSVNFGPGSEAAMEIDLYGGIAPSYGGFDFDLGGIYYAYPGADSDNNFDFFEAYAGVARAFGPVTAGLSGAYSPEFFGDVGPATWGLFSASVGVPSYPITVDASVGQQWYGDLEDADYMTWSTGAAVDVVGLTIGAMVTGTDLDSEVCEDLCDTRFVLSVSRGM